MADPVPIRPELQSIIDGLQANLATEMKSALADRVDGFVECYGEVPLTYALVLTGGKGRTVHTFTMDPDTNNDRLATCGAAVLLLSQYGLER